MTQMRADYKITKSDADLIVCPACGGELRQCKDTVSIWCPCGKIIDLKEASKRK